MCGTREHATDDSIRDASACRDHGTGGAGGRECPAQPVRVRFKLIICPTESGRAAEATAALEELRSIHPQSGLVPTGLGVVALMTGDPERARNDFNQVLETDPWNVLALQCLAAPAQALRRCEEILQIQAGKSTEDCIHRNRLRLETAKSDRR